MILIDIAGPRDALDDADRSMIADDILSGLVGTGAGTAEEVPEETMRRVRTMAHLGFRELLDWTTGDGPWRPPAVPPLWLTITVPESWRDETARHTIGWVRRAIRRLDDRHGWQRIPGALWINVIGIGDGSIGLGGKPATADDVLEHMTEDFRANLAQGRTLPEGTVVDPMCGMLVRLGPRAITLDHDGETFGFCAEACRDSYVRRYAASG